MDMTGERRIAAPRSRVWDALNDVVVLKASIPGCESLEKQSDNAMRATAAVKIGPLISASFQLATSSFLSWIRRVATTISGEGQGGVARFCQGRRQGAAGR